MLQKEIVLMYHCVYETDPTTTGFQNGTAFKYKISAANFSSQVELIHDYLETNKIPREKVRFTFDDGGVSFVKVIMPILDKYGFKGIFFISSNYISTKGFLNEEQICELYQHGHIIGSHSKSHPERMDVLSSDALNGEWKDSLEILTQILKVPVTYASIPNGYSSQAVTSSMQMNGIKKIYTSEPTTNVRLLRDSQIIGRFVVTSDMSNQDVLRIVSSSFCRFKIVMRYKVIELVKLILGDTYLKIRSRLLSTNHR